MKTMMSNENSGADGMACGHPLRKQEGREKKTKSCHNKNDNENVVDRHFLFFLLAQFHYTITIPVYLAVTGQ